MHLPPALGAMRSLHTLGPGPSESLLTHITLEVSLSDVCFSDELPVCPFSPLGMALVFVPVGHVGQWE